MSVVVGSQDDVPLVGRQRELEVLRAAVTSAAGGTPSALLVAGEAGGGKTRLLRELLDGLPPAASLVVRAQCVDLGDPGLPYLVMVDLVRALQARAAAEPDLAAVLDAYPVVMALTDPAVTGDGAVDPSRRLQLFDALTALLAEVGRVRGPVVVAVEDLQWVDASSADFLRFLLSRMLSERLVLVATVRTDGLAARPRVRRLVSELGRLPTVRRIDLEPFDATEVAQFLAEVGEPGAPEVVAEVFRRTRGNPYYVQVLAAGVLESGGVDEAMPRALGDLLVGRLDGLPDDVRSVVRCASVVAGAVPDRLLRRVVGLAEAATDEALRTAVAQGLLVPDGDGYAFVHDLLRSAVYDDLLPGERARLHAAYAAARGRGSRAAAPGRGGAPRRPGPGRAEDGGVVDPGGCGRDATPGTGRGSAPPGTCTRGMAAGRGRRCARRCVGRAGGGPGRARRWPRRRARPSGRVGTSRRRTV